MSLLETDNKLVKEYGLTEVHELKDSTPMGNGKMDFVKSQLDSLKLQLWRTRVDIMLNENITTHSDEEKDQVAAKIKEHMRELKRTAEVITLLDKIYEELK